MSAYERNHQVSQPTLRREGEAKSKRSLPRKENAWESPPTFILGKTLEKPKRGLRIFKMRVRELYTHREGISTPHAHHKGRQPLIECAKHDFKILYFPFLYFYFFWVDKGVSLASTYPQVQ